MTPEAAKSTYRRMLDQVGETVFIRRYAGAGPSRPRVDATVTARVTGYDEKDFVGSIITGDRKVIVLAQDLIDAQFALPVLTSDKVVVRGKEMAIIAADDSSRRIDGVLVALELQVRAG